MEFKELLEKKNKADKKYILLDGAMGTMLQASGLKLGQIPEVLSFTNEELLVGIHRQYVESGSDIIYTNTFGGNRYKLEGCGYTVEQVIKKGIENARKACEGTDCIVALDLGPIGRLVEPTGDLKFEEAYDIYKEQVIAGREADVIVFETMTDLLELKAAVLAAKENTELPIICTMTFEQNMRTFTGCQVSSMALTMEGLGVDALGVNCSLGPDELYPVVEELGRYTRLPLVVKPNAGLPDPVTNEYNVTPQEFAAKMAKMAQIGVTIMGGCCGTSPAYIAELKKALDGAEFVREERAIPSAVCSASNTIVINQPRIIGERINPTGKKLFKQALKDHNLDYIMNQALEQIDGGAEILDVNVGLPEIDERSMMVDAIRAIQSVCDVPLQIDSTIPEVLEAGLRIYCGKPIVNSVNGEENSLNNVLPLDDVIHILDEYRRSFSTEISSSAHFFVNQSGAPLSDQSVRRMINKYCSLAAIDLHITPHMFRHTFATSLLEADVDIRYIQEMLGHSSINVTQIYTHVAVGKQRDILRNKHPRKGFRVGGDN